MNQDKTIAWQVYEKMMEKDFFSQWMGIKPLIIEEGHCKLKMTVTKEMLNGFQILHGGIAFAFADSAFAFASNSFGRLSVSINGQMTYVKSSVEGDVIIAEAKLIHMNHKLANFDVSLINEKTSEELGFFRGTVYRKKELVLEL